MKCCPKCKGTTGYRSSAQVTGTVYLEEFWEEPESDRKGDRESIDNAGMYDGLNYKYSKNVVCLDCNKRIKLSEVTKNET